MIVTEAEKVIRVIKGYWAIPQMLEDEKLAWVSSLTNPRANLEVGRALATVDRLAATEEHRPRPGSFAQLCKERLVSKERQALTPNCPICNGSSFVQEDPTRSTVGPQNVVRCLHCSGTGSVDPRSIRYVHEDHGALATKGRLNAIEIFKDRGIKTMDPDGDLGDF